jgi:hypothetical protein
MVVSRQHTNGDRQRHREPTAGPAPPMAFVLDVEALRPLVRAIVAEAVAELEKDRATLPDRLAFSEAEAAALLGLHAHQLRDERRRGKISASEIVGKRIRYLRSDLLQYLAARRLNEER